jgi:hypothetical protein
MGLTAIVTNAGRAALVNAANTGTRAVTIAQVGLSGTALAPEPGATVLPGQFKTIATLSGDVVADDTIHLIVRDESADVFTVRSLALYLADGTLFALYGQADVLLEKSAQALMLLAIDIRFEDVDASAITFGDTNFLNPPATTEAGRGRTGDRGRGTGRDRRPARPHAAGRALGHPRVAAGAGRRGSGVDADLLDGQHGSYYTNIAARLGYVPGPDQRWGRKRARRRPARWSGQQLFREHPGASGIHPGQQGGDNVTGTFVFGTAGGNGRRHAPAATCTPVQDPIAALRFGDSNARYIEYNGSRFYFNECEIYSGPSNSLTWNAGNDGAGSGLDADLLDGQQGSWYADIIGRLGYAPVQQGTGIGQQSNAIKIGWNGSKLQLTVDTYDQGNIVTEPNLANATLNVNAAYVQRNNNHLWGPDNDGSGSGLDADLLDGFQADAFARITAQSIGSTGYLVLSNGLKIVYGTVQLTQDAYSYATFPLPSKAPRRSSSRPSRRSTTAPTRTRCSRPGP